MRQNIFQDINKPIKFEAIGKNCIHSYCFNCSHFMSLGIIPSINTPTYADLRNRQEAKWYTNSFKNFLSQKLSDENKEYSYSKKLYVNIKYKIVHILRDIGRKLKIINRKMIGYGKQT